ncbi:hypothetical protein D3C74_291570 [compost metagenome]
MTRIMTKNFNLVDHFVTLIQILFLLTEIHLILTINVLNESGARIRDVFWEISDLAADLDDTVIMGMKKIDEYGNWIIKLSNTTNKNLSVKVYSLQEIILGYITIE